MEVTIEAELTINPVVSAKLEEIVQLASSLRRALEDFPGVLSELVTVAAPAKGEPKETPLDRIDRNIERVLGTLTAISKRPT